MSGKNSLLRGILLTLCSVALLAFCVPGKPFPWLAWIAMVPLFIELRRISPLRGFILTGFYGWLSWLVSIWWLHEPLRDMLGMLFAAAIFVTMAGCLLMAFPYAVAGAIIGKCSQRDGIRSAARDAAVFTVLITFLTPVFQGNLAHFQYKYPVVLQVAELGGAPLLLFLIFFFNGLIADGVFYFQKDRRASWKAFGAATALLAFILGYGVVRMKQFEAEMAAASPGQWFTVGAVQPNIPITVAVNRQPDPIALSNNFSTAIEQAKTLTQKNPQLDLIAFPEAPETFIFNDDTERRQALRTLIDATGKPVMLNADAIDTQTKDAVPERYNVALLVDAKHNLAGHYAKIKRLPLVEYLPYEKQLPWLRKLFPKGQRVLAGSGPAIFEVKPGIHVIPLICYEGTVSSFTRSFLEKGGNVIVNLVNDSWFLRTPASEVHLALTLFRTVEYRVPLVRVTNSGISAHIRADGTIILGSRTALFTKTATAFPLYVPPHRSIYARIGNYWMLGFLLLLSSFGKRREKPSANSKGK